jgi:hypothetical protein
LQKSLHDIAKTNTRIEFIKMSILTWSVKKLVQSIRYHIDNSQVHYMPTDMPCGYKTVELEFLIDYINQMKWKTFDKTYVKRFAEITSRHCKN